MTSVPPADSSRAVVVKKTEARRSSEPSSPHGQGEAFATAVPLVLTVALILVSLLAWTAKSETDLFAWGISYGPRTLHQPWRLMSALFLETDTVVLIMNSCLIFYFARALSRAFGPLTGGLVYLLAGATGVLVATLVHPQDLIATSHPGVIALCGSLLATCFSGRRRQPLPRDISVLMALYALVATTLLIQHRLHLPIQAVALSLACGFAIPFFTRLSRRHVLIPAAGVFVILLTLRLSLNSMPSSIDRFALSASLTKLRTQTTRDLKMIDDRFRKGEINERELAALLAEEVLEPSRHLIQDIEAADSLDVSLRPLSSDHAWLQTNVAELKFRVVSLEVILAVYAAKMNLMEADDLARRHQDGGTAGLDRFWLTQLPTLRHREQEILMLGTQFPQEALHFHSLRKGLQKDLEILTAGATSLETQRVQFWLIGLKMKERDQDQRLPSSSLSGVGNFDFHPPGLNEEIVANLARLERTRDATLTGSPERQRLIQLEDFVLTMQELTRR